MSFSEGEEIKILFYYERGFSIMKKNKMMRLASGLLIAVLLTTCAIAGTFAKYTTSATGSDSARVAKWGVTITANGETFKTNYDNTAISAVVEEDIVAPGTSGDLVAMTIGGTPEVKVEVKYESVLTLTGWQLADSTEYCPIVFTVGSQTYGTNDTDATNKSANINELITAVQGAINGYTADYDANVNLATYAETPVVSWAWAYAGNDSADTYLGNQASIGNAPIISLSITTTITQID